MTCRRRQSGQATIEFALIIPLVLLVLMGIAQLVVVGYLQLAVSHVSREIARELAVDPSADVGHLAAERSFLGHDGLLIETEILRSTSDGSETVVVRVSHDAIAISGVFQRFLADVTLTAETKMRVEIANFP